MNYFAIAMLIWISGGAILISGISLFMLGMNPELVGGDGFGGWLLLVGVIFWPLTVVYVLLGLLWLLANMAIDLLFGPATSD